LSLLAGELSVLTDVMALPANRQKLAEIIGLHPAFEPEAQKQFFNE
jgi:hypothetical protein